MRGWQDYGWRKLIESKKNYSGGFLRIGCLAVPPVPGVSLEPE